MSKEVQSTTTLTRFVKHKWREVEQPFPPGSLILLVLQAMRALGYDNNTSSLQTAYQVCGDDAYLKLREILIKKNIFLENIVVKENKITKAKTKKTTLTRDEIIKANKAKSVIESFNTILETFEATQKRKISNQMLVSILNLLK